MSRAKRWARKIRLARWRLHKRQLIASGRWVEVGPNTLVPRVSVAPYQAPGFRWNGSYERPEYA